ncbi:MAG: zinc ribbon domain-containing protein [Deltaproteobacteria bacterium]|nr:zinc ribbon domain-containing protein [Deltaproteobacteria bacterium]
MPIYEYRCQDCQQIFEEWQKGYEDQSVPCPVCGGTSKRLISNTCFVLKGSGWYVTDYCRKGEHSSQTAAGGNGDGQKKQETASSSEKSSATTDSSASPQA